jgi:glucokinase
MAPNGQDGLHAGSGNVLSSRPVLEVGGTHVRASRVDLQTWREVPGSALRMPLDGGGSAHAIVGTMAACADVLRPAASETLAVAMPGPMEYPAGIGRFADVAKFDALAGVDVGQSLLTRMAHPPARVAFINDAEAFGLGEWIAGSARGYECVAAVTLGSGIGSAFIRAGEIVSSGPLVPPGGHVHRLAIDGRPLEDTVSRRAIIAAYRRGASPQAQDGARDDDGPGIDVRDIAARALDGDSAASRVFTDAFRLLGAALAPWLARFGAQLLVVGGGMAGSWELIREPLRTGLGDLAPAVAVVRSADPEAATAAGAAWYCAATADAPTEDAPQEGPLAGDYGPAR